MNVAKGCRGLARETCEEIRRQEAKATQQPYQSGWRTMGVMPFWDMRVTGVGGSPQRYQQQEYNVLAREETEMSQEWSSEVSLFNCLTTKGEWSKATTSWGGRRAPLSVNKGTAVFVCNGILWVW
jgi:hypothetical protein